MTEQEKIAQASQHSDKNFAEDLKRLEKFFADYVPKQVYQEFMEQQYLKREAERVAIEKAQAAEEYANAHVGSTPYYTPGHIGPLVDEYMNMISVEGAITNGLQHTKGSLVKSIIQRIDEVNTLLRGVGGFNRQIKPSFTRSAVNYLEKEDPTKRTRERIAFTVNLSDFELKYPLLGKQAEQLTDDGRTISRYAWDFAVNTLAEIVAGTGLKPKFVLNNKNNLQFIMKQDSFPKNDRKRTPDEYFEFEMIYFNEENKRRSTELYTAERKHFQDLLQQAVDAGNQREISRANDELDFFLGVTPDPANMDLGLNLIISAFTLKDYSLTKDKMQVIMTKFILALSKLSKDKSLDEQLMNSLRGVENKTTEETYLKEKLAQMNASAAVTNSGTAVPEL